MQDRYFFLQSGTNLKVAPTDSDGTVGGLGVWVEALRVWVEKGRPGPASRWMARELDPDGVPRRLPVSEWVLGLVALAEAERVRPEGWPDEFDARAEGWFRALLRFSRTNGAPAFSDAEPPGRGFARWWAERLSDPGLSTVVDWWFPPAKPGRHAPPPLPADSRPDRPLAVLRANWLKDGDFLAVDHRVPGLSSQVELFAHGRTWLGPTWTPPEGASCDAPTRARPLFWVSQSSSDAFEWGFRVGRARVTRTVVLLRGRRLALVAEQWDGPGDPGAWRIALSEGVTAEPMTESRGISLTADRCRVMPRVLPVGLPKLPYDTDRGGFSQRAGFLELRQRTEGRRTWRPLLVSWEPSRDRKPVHWRVLTVTEGGRLCGPETAFAARVTWGRDETLVVYRSLARARPATRAFLGHQTKARFLMGVFTKQGEVEPLLKVDE